MAKKENCNHKNPEICKWIKEFRTTHKGKIYGYLRLFTALNRWVLKNKNQEITEKISQKQVRKIMKEHNWKGKSRTNLGYKKEVKITNKWKPEMDLINNIYNSTTSSNQIWSMDTKQVMTKQGWIYILAIRDFYSQAIIGYKIDKSKSYDAIVGTSLTMALSSFSKEQLKGTILHSDNALEFYCDKLQKNISFLNMKLSKKKPNNMGGNALSENWFYHLEVEWLPNEWNMYETCESAIKDIEEYIKFYNYERIHSKFNAPPMEHFRIE